LSADNPAHPEELEAKFSFEDGEALRDWFDEAFPIGDGEGWRTHQITDTYFDTADEVLEQAGYGARLRTVGPTTTLTIKADIEVMLADDRRAWVLGTDDRWRRVEETTPEPRGVDTFETLMAMARSSVVG